MRGAYSHANQPSSSSLLVGAGSGAPGDSWVGSWTKPCLPNGFSDEILDRSGLLGDEVLAGASASLRDQPSEFIESRKFDEAMMTGESSFSGGGPNNDSVARNVTPGANKICPLLTLWSSNQWP